jgi:HAD superfamily hydrolase (TIGR01509 family)
MPLDWGRIQAICFDVDGTLSDTDNHMVTRLFNSLSWMRWLVRDDARKRLARLLVMAAETPGNYLYNVADRLGIDRAALELSDWANRHALRRRPDQFWIIPRVKPMLAEFEKRLPLAIVSARGRLGTEAFLKQFDLAQYFRAVATSQTCRHTKPFPDPVIWVAGQMGVSPANCLMVGDTVVDIRAGQAAGAQTVAVLCGFGTRRELERVGPDLVLNSTSNLLKDYLSSHPRGKQIPS